MSEQPAIVVLTPLKNDAWILRRFLQVTSAFADRIIIADQGSTDGGPAICRDFDTVTLIDNSASDYDEASRQELLIATARRLVPMPRILIALDTDEILTATSVGSAGWRTMLAASPGTIVFFEKPNLFLSPALVERMPHDFPGAFVDDGVTPHRAQRIHSRRLPMPPDGATLVLEDVKFLHYALTRPDAQKAKFRMYAALENVMGTKPLYRRRRYYWSRPVLKARGTVEPTPPEWYAGWEERGIDMKTIDDRQPYWQDVATLELLLEHGSLRFWLDDIWEKDWRAFMREIGREGRVIPPPRLLRLALEAAQIALESLAAVRRRLLQSRT